MANTISTKITRTQMQAADALSGNGTAVDVTGHNDCLIAIMTRASAAAGIFTFEESSDAGQNWSAVTCTRVSDGTTASATNAAELGISFIVPIKDGPRQLRARISTNWTTASPQVNVIVLTR